MRSKLQPLSRERLIECCTSLSTWQLPKQSSALAPDHIWTNEDMDPVKIEDQTWTLWTWMAYWASDTISVGTWETAGSIIALGLSWREAIPIVVVGSTCSAIPMVLNGAIGAKLHIPFSVAIRASFGYYLGYFCVASRCILAMFWFGVVTTNGSTAVTVMIEAIFPSYGRIKNHIPASSGITTQGMISYFIFWIFQLPVLLIPPQKLRYLFTVKLLTTPLVALATMAWCAHKAGGAGPVFELKATVSGSTKAYLWLTCMSSISGSWSTLVCNIPDFTRYARSSRGQYIQLPFLPLIQTLGALVGIIGTSAAGVIYGELIWNPILIHAKWLEKGSSGGRAAAFFCCLAWFISQVCTNVTANSISAANDLTVLFPRYINIRRGCVIAALIGGWVLVPWKILSTATTFLTFMNGYTIFLAPIGGILCADFWLVKKRNVDIPALYDPAGRYRYWKGMNWRALITFMTSCTPNLAGLISAIAKSGGSTSIHISAGAKHLYTFNFLFGFTTSVVLYTFLSFVFPAPVTIVEETIYGLEATIMDRDVECEKGSDNDDKVDSVTMSPNGIEKAYK